MNPIWFWYPKLFNNSSLSWKKIIKFWAPRWNVLFFPSHSRNFCFSNYNPDSNFKMFTSRLPDLHIGKAVFNTLTWPLKILWLSTHCSSSEEHLLLLQKTLALLPASTWSLQSVCDSGSRGSDAPFWPLLVPAFTCCPPSPWEKSFFKCCLLNLNQQKITDLRV